MTEASTGGTIVVGVDGSEASRAALRWAARQAKLSGSSLKVVTAWEIPTLYGEGMVVFDDFDFAEDAAKRLKQVVAEELDPASGVPLEAVTVEGHPAPTLCSMAEGADLLVVGRSGHGEFTGMLLGSVSEFAATHAHCPVVIVR